MDQYQFRGKLLKNFKGHSSIRISPEKQGKGAIGPYELPLKFTWTNGSEISLWKFWSTPASVHRVLFSEWQVFWIYFKKNWHYFGTRLFWYPFGCLFWKHPNGYQTDSFQNRKFSEFWKFRQPVDPVVGDPVRQDSDKIWILGSFVPSPCVILIGNFRIYLCIVSLVVILSNWVCDNWLYRFPKIGTLVRVCLGTRLGSSNHPKKGPIHISPANRLRWFINVDLSVVLCFPQKEATSTMDLLSVNSPALISSENSGVSFAKNQLRLAKNRLDLKKMQNRARNRPNWLKLG